MKKSKLLAIPLSLVVVLGVFVGCGKNEVIKDAHITEAKQTSSKLNELEVKNAERFFKSEVAPKSKAEKVILEAFEVNISDAYDKLNDLYINEAGGKASLRPTRKISKMVYIQNN